MSQEQFQRIGTAVRAYYSQTEPEPHHFTNWINSLDEPMKTVFSGKSFDECKGVLNFRRFVAELNSKGLDEHMQQHLSPKDYALWRQVK